VERDVSVFSPEFSQQILQRVADGHKPEEVARQLGRTPATVRHCLSVIEESAPEASDRLSLSQRATAWGNELVASFVSPSESRYVAQITRELLRLHWVVTACHPGLLRREIYRKIVMAHTGCDDAEAGSLLRRAEQSFATWPTERELTFADVVHYLAVSEYLTDDDRIATRINMGRLIAGRIPADL
jgi:transposase-like protein